MLPAVGALMVRPPFLLQVEQVLTRICGAMAQLLLLDRVWL